MIGADLLPTATALLKAVRMQTELSPWADRLWEVACLTDPTELMYARDLWWQMGIRAPKGDRRLLSVGLPTAKTIVRLVRYCHTAALWERHDTPEQVAERMGLCRLFVLDRHLRRYHDMNAWAMRDTVPFPMAREQLLDQIVRPYRYDWAILATGPWFARDLVAA